MSKKRKRLYRKLYPIMLFLNSLAIVLMSFTHPQFNGNRFGMILNGIMFWCSLIGFIAVALRIKVSRWKDMEYRQYLFGNQKHLSQSTRLSRFFQKRYIIVVDILLICAVAGVLIAYFITRNDRVLLILAGMIVFLLGMLLFYHGADYQFLSEESLGGLSK